MQKLVGLLPFCFLLTFVGLISGISGSCKCEYNPNIFFGALTPFDKNDAVWAWNHNVEGRYAAVGEAVFRELFRRAPDAYEFFRHLYDARFQDLFSSPRFKNHMVQRLIPALRSIYENLGIEYHFNQVMADQGYKHIRRGVKREHVILLLCVIVDTLGATFGSRNFPQWACIATNRVLNAAFNHFISALESGRFYGAMLPELTADTSEFGLLTPETSYGYEYLAPETSYGYGQLTSQKSPWYYAESDHPLKNYWLSDPNAI